MVRIVGVNLPNKKRVAIGLTYIYGIGNSLSARILNKVGINPDTKVSELTDEQANLIRKELQSYQTEGDMRRAKSLAIKRMVDLGIYRGLRHRKKLPARGQRTRTNARTCKGPRRRSSR